MKWGDFMETTIAVSFAKGVLQGIEASPDSFNVAAVAVAIEQLERAAEILIKEAKKKYG
jgi:hypothetical protein